MTYIIAGKKQNSTFMMADTIVTNVETKQKTIVNKMIKLESSKSTYYTFTGVQFIDNCVRTYDFWLSNTKRESDFISGVNSIKELQSVIKRMIDTFSGREQMTLEINRLFFINKNNVIYYDLAFDSNNELLKDAEKNILNDNEFIDSSVLTGIKEGIPEMDIQDFCKNYLAYLSKKNVDFKDRYSFVELFADGKETFNEPFKNFSDLIALYNNVDFSELDNPDFTWNI